MIRRPPISTRTDTPFPYTTLFRSPHQGRGCPALHHRPIQNSSHTAGSTRARKWGLLRCLRGQASNCCATNGQAASWRYPAKPDRTRRSVGRRVGKESVSTWRSRWVTDQSKKKETTTKKEP